MRNCSVCGDDFLPAYPSQEHCSTQCRKTATKKPPKRTGRPPGFQDPQTRCRMTDCTERGVHQHHVVLRQHVEAQGGDIADPRNALSLCELHHTRHHRAKRRVKISELRPENIEYARELYGDWGDGYLAGHYDAS